MSREHVLVLLGLMITIMPFSGLPLMWRSVGACSVGVLVTSIGISLIARKRAAPHHEASTPHDAA